MGASFEYIPCYDRRNPLRIDNKLEIEGEPDDSVFLSPL